MVHKIWSLRNIHYYLTPSFILPHLSLPLPLFSCSLIFILLPCVHLSIISRMWQTRISEWMNEWMNEQRLTEGKEHTNFGMASSSTPHQMSLLITWNVIYKCIVPYNRHLSCTLMLLVVLRGALSPFPSLYTWRNLSLESFFSKAENLWRTTCGGWYCIELFCLFVFVFKKT